MKNWKIWNLEDLKIWSWKARTGRLEQEVEGEEQEVETRRQDKIIEILKIQILIVIKLK